MHFILRIRIIFLVFLSLKGINRGKKEALMCATTKWRKIRLQLVASAMKQGSWLLNRFLNIYLKFDFSLKNHEILLSKSCFTESFPWPIQPLAFLILRFLIEKCWWKSPLLSEILGRREMWDVLILTLTSEMTPGLCKLSNKQRLLNMVDTANTSLRVKAISDPVLRCVKSINLYKEIIILDIK